MPKPKALNIKSVTKTLALKFYEEQLLTNEEELKKVIETTSDDRIIIAIKHQETGGKPHWHIAMKMRDRNGSLYVASELKRLGIRFRPEDENLLNNHGIETVGNFTNFITYLLHKTDFARKQHKREYNISDFISNVTADELTEIVNDYVPKSARLTNDELIDFARNTGYALEDFYEALERIGKKGLTASLEKKMLAAHKAGIKKRILTDGHINRLSIEINCKNDYKRVLSAVEQAVSDKKYVKALTQYDPVYVPIDTKAFITKYNTFDNKLYINSIVEVGTVGYNYPYIPEKTFTWAGNMVIVIKEGQGFNHSDVCFCCSVENGKLINKSCPPLPQNDEELSELKQMYIEFRDAFNTAYSNYSREVSKVTFNDLND